MNKAGLIEKIADKTSVNKKDVETTIDAMIEFIIEELLADRKVNIVGFGSFEAKVRHARGGINPQKPSERITIPEVRVAKFKTGKTLKDALKGKITLKEAKASIEAETEAQPTETEEIMETPAETTPETQE